jgi:hypothetical protein
MKSNGRENGYYSKFRFSRRRYLTRCSSKKNDIRNFNSACVSWLLMAIKSHHSLMHSSNFTTYSNTQLLCITVFIFDVYSFTSTTWPLFSSSFHLINGMLRCMEISLFILPTEALLQYSLYYHELFRFDNWLYLPNDFHHESQTYSEIIVMEISMCDEN